MDIPTPTALREKTSVKHIAAPNHSITVPRSATTISGRELSMVLVLAEDRGLGKDVSDAFAANGRVVQVYSSSEKFFALYHPDVEACLLVDLQLLDASGLQLLRQLRRSGLPPPAIAIIAHNDVQMAVQAMKASALDCIERPFKLSTLVASIECALERSRASTKWFADQRAAAERLDSLTPRERQVMDLVLAGHPNKNIAADLGVSQRTVESHRAAIMRKSGTKSLPALVRLVLAAGLVDDPLSSVTDERSDPESPIDPRSHRRQIPPYYPNLPFSRPPDRLNQASGELAPASLV